MNHWEKRLTKELSAIIGDRGEVVEVRMHNDGAPHPVSEWSAIVTTEHAALKLFYQYRYNVCRIKPNPRNTDQWLFSIG